jgi:hypothetical protein
MFGSQVLDIAIGMVFVYLTLSLLCSGLTEWLAQLVGSRSKHLEGWMRELLSRDAPAEGAKTAQSNGDKLQEFWDHPLIKALQPNGKKPSYIPARTFMLALLDVIAPIEPGAGSRTLDDVRKKIAELPNADLQKTLLALLDDAGDNMVEVRQNIERWFDDSMERLAGWYKRRIRWVIIVLALVISVGLNVDSLRLANALYRDATLRQAVVASAQRATPPATPPASEDAPPSPLTQINAVQTELQQLNLPIGWSDRKYLQGLGNPFGLLAALVGWALTALAVSQGAPFWFDLLNKLVNLRSTGQRPTVPQPTERRETQVVIQATPTLSNGQPVAQAAVYSAASAGD